MMMRQLLSRTIATLTRRMQQPISHTSEGAVVVSYPSLVSLPLSVGDAIGMYTHVHGPGLAITIIAPNSFFFPDEAFGSHPKSLGIIIVRDLPPEYPVYRERLLKLAYQFAQLPEDVREKHIHSASRYRYVVNHHFFIFGLGGFNFCGSFGWSHGKVWKYPENSPLK